MSMANTARFRVKGLDGIVEVDFDVETWRGDVLLTLEEHLGGEGLFAWARRWADALGQGLRLSEFRVTDIVGLIYLGCAQADPDTTWQRVARAISPLTVTPVPDEEPASPAPVPAYVDPGLGQQVAAPGSLSPTLAALGAKVADGRAGHELFEPSAPEDHYRTP